MSDQSAKKGVTLVEVLLAVVISAIGFAAVLSMQISSVQGNISAREVASAVNLAESAIETLQRESYKWVSLDPPEPYLNKTENEWFTMTPDPVDHNGRVARSVNVEMGSLTTRQRFCIHYMIDRLNGGFGGLISGRVRVVWPYATLSENDFETACAQDALDGFVPTVGTWYSLTLPWVVRAGGGS
ncbi:MAG: type IV pilus modification PilV family protein [Bradymonadia bacterium]